MKDVTQYQILKDLEKDNYFDIKLPNDEFFDEESSCSEQEDNEQKRRYRFGHNIYECYGSYYLAETVLHIDSQRIKFNMKVDINVLVSLDLRQPWFDMRLFQILFEFCKGEKKNFIFNPDYILNDVSGKLLLDNLPSFKQNIKYFRNWIKAERKYDLIGEISIDYLTKSKEKKYSQTLKYIRFIKLLKSIENDNSIERKKKTLFEEKFNLIYGNEKVLVITTDGNYEQYLKNLRTSKIFGEDEKKEEEKNYYQSNNIETEPIKILKLLNTDINFILTYVPRAYVNIKTNQCNEIKALREKLQNLERLFSKKFEEQNLSIAKLTEENKIFQTQIRNFETQVTNLTEENKKMKMMMKEY